MLCRRHKKNQMYAEKVAARYDPPLTATKLGGGHHPQEHSQKLACMKMFVILL